MALNASFQNKTNGDYIADLGNAVVNLVRIVPEGALLVFHSYSQMNHVVTVWRDSGIFSRISKDKTVFIEPRNAGELQDVLKQFAHATLANSGGALLLCVCRGKVTEGVDLADNQCRVVIMAGIPFPATMDRKVVLKREYLDAKNFGNGGKWYRQEAARTVNQTIGRVIRHRLDYGSILLCDDRYRSYTDELPSWVLSQVKIFPSFGPVVKELTDFFRNIPPELRRTKIRQLKRNTSLTTSGDGSSDKQLESIQRLISSVPTSRILPNFATTPQLPSISGPQGVHAFKMSSRSAEIKHQPLSRHGTDSTPHTQSSKSLTTHEWLERMKATLTHKDYISLKKSLRRLLEGAHGQCQVTITESLKQLHGFLETTNMIETFESVISGNNNMLRSEWARIANRD